MLCPDADGGNSGYFGAMERVGNPARRPEFHAISTRKSVNEVEKGLSGTKLGERARFSTAACLGRHGR